MLRYSYLQPSRGKMRIDTGKMKSYNITIAACSKQDGKKAPRSAAPP